MTPVAAGGTGEHSAVCVCVCVCVSINYFALVLSLCCSTGVRVGAFGSESSMYMVYFIYGNGNIEQGGWKSIIDFDFYCHCDHS